MFSSNKCFNNRFQTIVKIMRFSFQYKFQSLQKICIYVFILLTGRLHFIRKSTVQIDLNII